MFFELNQLLKIVLLNFSFIFHFFIRLFFLLIKNLSPYLIYLKGSINFNH
ncbi:hypothetical protein PROPEN_03055 [Proteus penneri ATCC 35198]|nr:hypothetical protein PROPEN_03055 [Proteus penneri ATCC 35198]